MADHVPEQLVVIRERQRRARDRVVDRVRVLAGDRAVRIADADPAERTFIRQLDVVGRPGARRHSGDFDVVAAIVVVVERSLRDEVALDAVMRAAAEVVDDLLLDGERAVGFDADVDGVVGDAFGAALRGRGVREREKRRAEEDDEDRDAPHVTEHAGQARADRDPTGVRSSTRRVLK